jgi:hypothetical protein
LRRGPTGTPDAPDSRPAVQHRPGVLARRPADRVQRGPHAPRRPAEPAGNHGRRRTQQAPADQLRRAQRGQSRVHARRQPDRVREHPRHWPTAPTSPTSARRAATGDGCSPHRPTRPIRFPRPTARGSPSPATATAADGSGWAPASSSTPWPSTARTSDGSPPIARPTSSPTGSACPRHRRTSRRERPTQPLMLWVAGSASSSHGVVARRTDAEEPVGEARLPLLRIGDDAAPHWAGNAASPPMQGAVHAR